MSCDSGQMKQPLLHASTHHRLQTPYTPTYVQFVWQDPVCGTSCYGRPTVPVASGPQAMRCLRPILRRTGATGLLAARHGKGCCQTAKGGWRTSSLVFSGPIRLLARAVASSRFLEDPGFPVFAAIPAHRALLAMHLLANNVSQRALNQPDTPFALGRPPPSNSFQRPRLALRARRSIYITSASRGREDGSSRASMGPPCSRTMTHGLPSRLCQCLPGLLETPAPRPAIGLGP
ncbi:hypothetical protein VTK73DRAFT_3020 [Phialemonium thermophilum]|uniref:Uncharacterized protein n=1 Tax=Phialemonium thermophilum TaxID=223376 RepID=A0ABR3VLU3_9PEZI